MERLEINAASYRNSGPRIKATALLMTVN